MNYCTKLLLKIKQDTVYISTCTETTWMSCPILLDVYKSLDLAPDIY